METIQNSTADLLSRVVHEFGVMRPLLPTYLHLIISAVFPIYTASHAALARPSSAAPAKKRKKAESSEVTDEDDEVEETSPRIETLQPSDAILFPILAGCTLAGLYFVLKFFQDPMWLNWFLGIYFACIGFFFMVRFLKDGFGLVQSAVFPKQYTYGGKVWRVSSSSNQYVARDDAGHQSATSSPMPGILRNIPVPVRVEDLIWAMRKTIYARCRLELRVHSLLHAKSPVDVLDVVSVALSLIAVVYHTFVDKPWFLTNLLGFSFCYGSLQFVTPGTSWTGTAILSALFFYDIYFVFFTPMMVTVATKLDVPIKLLFPRPDGCVYPHGAEEGSEAMKEYLQCIAKKRTMAMLGLGDIVVPGMMLAFALRFDLYLFYLRKTKPSSATSPSSNIVDSDQPETENGKSMDKDRAEVQKPKYHSATGSWGERFWTSTKTAPHSFDAKTFPKTYFHATIIGYVLGMIVTVLVMQIAQHAQPALLYLVPGVLLSLWGTALVKGDFKKLYAYSEVPEEPADDKKDKSSKTNDRDQKDKTKTEKAKNAQSDMTMDKNNMNDKTEETDDVPNTKDGLEGDDKGNGTTDDNKNTKGGESKDHSGIEKKDTKHTTKPRHLIYFAIDTPRHHRHRHRQTLFHDDSDNKKDNENDAEDKKTR